MRSGRRVTVTLDLTVWDVPQLIERLRDSGHAGVLYVARQIEAQTRPPKPEEPTDLAARVYAAGTTWAKISSWWVPVAMGEHARDWDWLVERDDFRVVQP